MLSETMHVNAVLTTHANAVHDRIGMPVRYVTLQASAVWTTNDIALHDHTCQCGPGHKCLCGPRLRMPLRSSTMHANAVSTTHAYAVRALVPVRSGITHVNVCPTHTC